MFLIRDALTVDLDLILSLYSLDRSSSDVKPSSTEGSDSQGSYIFIDNFYFLSKENTLISKHIHVYNWRIAFQRDSFTRAEKALI
jgi:hypothetical protein